MIAPGGDLLSDYLDVAVPPRESVALISADSLQEIRRIARFLPANLTDFFGFECKLGSPESAADFLVCAKADGFGRDVLAALRPGQELPSSLDSPAWTRLRQFAATWADTSSPLFHKVHNCWLEFDVDGCADLPQPSVFLGTDDVRAELESDWLTGCALPILNGAPLDADAGQAIESCIQALPSGAYIFQVGRMLARSSTATRMCARGIPATRIPEYLDRIGWHGSSSDWAPLLERLGVHAEKIDIDFDIDCAVLGKIGLEYHLPNQPQALRSFVDQLQSLHLCCPEKASALLKWAGVASPSSSYSWPSELAKLSSFFQGRLHNFFARWVHHVKVVYEPGRPLHAKAYLAVKHLWLPSETLRTLEQARGEQSRLENSYNAIRAEETPVC